MARWAAEAEADYEVADVRDVVPLLERIIGDG